MLQTRFWKLAVVGLFSFLWLSIGTARAATFNYTGLAATCPFQNTEFCDPPDFVAGDPSNWGDHRNWSPQGVPGAADVANIGNHTVNIFGTRSVGRLILNGGTLGTGTLNLVGASGNGASSWTAGIINCTLTVAAGAQLTISGSTSRSFVEGAINNNGVVTWINNGAIFCSGAPVFNNRSGGVFNAQNNSNWFFSGGTTAPVFNNLAGATVNKSGADTTSSFGQVIFNNSGTVNAASGILDLNGGGTSPGTFTAANGGRVNVSGTLTGTLNPAAGGIIGIQQTSGGSTLLNTGLKCIGAGVSKIYGATVIFNGTVTTGQTGGPGTLQIENGNVIGTNASNLLSAGTGFYDWKGGTLSADGSIINIGAGGQFRISGPFSRSLVDGTINNNGTVTWIEDGAIFCANAPVFNNKSGGIFNAQSNANWFFSSGTSQPVFNNLAGGVVNKSGGEAISTFGQVLFNNAGTVNGLSGTLELNGGGTSPGTFTAADGARVNISGTLTGTLNAAAGGTIGIQQAGNGLGGGSTLLGGGLDCIGAGVSRVFSGTVTLNGMVTTGQAGGPGTLEFFSGTVIGTAASNLLSAGSGFYDWTSSTIGADGSIINIGAGAQFRISGASSRSLVDGTVNNSGTVTWIDNGAIFGQLAPVFNNKSGGVFNAQNNSSWFFSSGTSQPVFNNLAGGVVNKSGADTFSTFGQVLFNNSGTVNGLSGTLELNGGGNSPGTFTAANGGRVNVSGILTATFNPAEGGIIGIQQAGNGLGGGNTFLNTGAEFIGAGVSKVYSGIVTVNGTITTGQAGGPGTLEIENGNLQGTATSRLSSAGNGLYNWTAGIIGGTITITNTGQLRISGGNNKSFTTGTINNNGVVTWVDNGAVFCQGAPVFNNRSGSVFNAQNNSNWFYSSGPEPPVFNNLAGGTLSKSGAATTTSFGNVVFGNAGAININNSALSIGELTQTAGVTTLNGGTLSSNEVIALQGGTLTGNGDVNAHINNSGGTLSPGLSPGTITSNNYQQGANGALSVEFNGTAPATQDHLDVSGTVALGGDLNVALGFTPAIGANLTVINNDGSEAVTGTFSGLSQGAKLAANDAVFQISYNGGDGNDVVITRIAQPTLSVNDVTVTEGTGAAVNATFTVTLSFATPETVTVNAVTANGSALAPGDYTSGGSTLTFAPGQTTKTFSVSVVGDRLDEENENFFVILSAPANAALSRGRGTGTISDNDAPPAIGIENLSIGEGNAGQRTAVFRLVLSQASGKAVRVNYATAVGTTNPATAGNDYVTVAPTQVTFNVGQTVTLARVLINGDLLTEPDETFLINLSAPVNATLGDSQATGTILNDDSDPALSIDDVEIIEGNRGTKQLTFTVTLSKASGETVTVNFATANGTAQSTSDYVAQNGTLSFAPGSALTRTVSVSVNGDALDENDETFFVFLSSATNATISRARGIGTITNDDSSE